MLFTTSPFLSRAAGAPTQVRGVTSNLRLGGSIFRIPTMTQILSAREFDPPQPPREGSTLRDEEAQPMIYPGSALQVDFLAPFLAFLPQQPIDTEEVEAVQPRPDVGEDIPAEDWEQAEYSVGGTPDPQAPQPHIAPAPQRGFLVLAILIAIIASSVSRPGRVSRQEALTW